MESVLAKTNSDTRRARRLVLWVILPGLLLLSLAFVAIPAFLIQPFRPQTQRGMEVSYILRQWSPLVTAIVFICMAALVVWQWTRASRWWPKALMAIMLLLSLGPAWFARQNHFEWMFNPLRHTAYVKTTDATFVRDSDMVLAVNINDEAVAYPVRLMAYHHLVQDVVGGTPICATY